MAAKKVSLVPRLTAAGDGVIAAIEAHEKEQAARGRHTDQDKARRSVRWASENKPRSTETKILSLLRSGSKELP